ncbi:HK97-gp10 family putative phage morphogenesis protein [Streptomyces sp. NPDC059499]|uniref:HK97-gp10 family putative phage morphogenesis protein n=1 Tax=Streptomyces sp. NPDC059499 TaxID=3346852 RepID=UPI0036BE3157
MARRIRLDGLAGALTAVARVPEAMRQARSDTLNDWADDVQNTAEERTPRRTGNLWQALDQRVNEHFGRAEVGVWDPEELEYSLYVEKGTSSMADQPFLVPAFDQHRAGVPRTYRAAFRRRMGEGAG